jgi:acyl-CoA dehydrogenase
MDSAFDRRGSQLPLGFPGGDEVMSSDRTNADEEAAFVAEVRRFLSENLTPDMKAAGATTVGYYSRLDQAMAWHRCLHQKGWLAPTWPKAWGGTGWTARQRFLYDREAVRAHAPVLFASGMRSIGPLLIEKGTPEQQRKYIGPILTGEDLWCQGFSEPQAGSDLAAIQTRAVRENDHYVINGSKIWTTGAHDANRMFAIVRTSSRGKPQQGMTFLLIDMNSPGLRVVPILGLSGEHEFNQVFFDDVRVPVGNRVGEENDGWTVAKRLMALARSNNSPSALVRRVFESALAKVRSQGADLDPAIRSRLAGLSIDLDAYEQLEMSALADGPIAADDPKLPSTLKLVGSELNQRVGDFAREVAGPYAAVALDAEVLQIDGFETGQFAMAKYMNGRAASIYSGTSETHRNLIAKSLLAS